MRVRIKKLSETAVIPTRGSRQAAGYDLCADIREPLVMRPGESVKVDTGLAIAVPAGYFGGVFARSGLSTKKGIRPANCVGVIDADYRGPVMVPLFNDASVERVIEPGERIAQLIVLPCAAVEFEETTELDDTERGENGFGSTGV